MRVLRIIGLFTLPPLLLGLAYLGLLQLLKISTPELYTGRTTFISLLPEQDHTRLGLRSSNDALILLDDLSKHYARLTRSRMVMERACRTLRSLDIALSPEQLQAMTDASSVPQVGFVQIDVQSRNAEEAKAAADVVAFEAGRLLAERAYGRAAEESRRAQRKSQQQSFAARLERASAQTLPQITVTEPAYVFPVDPHNELKAGAALGILLLAATVLTLLVRAVEGRSIRSGARGSLPVLRALVICLLPAIFWAAIYFAARNVGTIREPPTYTASIQVDVKTPRHSPFNLALAGHLCANQTVMQRSANELQVLGISLDPIQLLRTTLVEPVEHTGFAVSVSAADEVEAKRGAGVIVDEFRGFYHEIVRSYAVKHRGFLEARVRQAEGGRAVTPAERAFLVKELERARKSEKRAIELYDIKVVHPVRCALTDRQIPKRVGMILGCLVVATVVGAGVTRMGLRAR